MKTKKITRENRVDKTGAVVRAGALISAILASACCWLPLLLIAFGVSGGALSAKFEAWRPVLLPVTFALLGMAFYFTYRKPRGAMSAPSGAGETCCAAPGAEKGAAPCCPSEGTGFTVKKMNKVMLWVITAFVLAFAFFPNYAGVLFRGGQAAPVPAGTIRVEWAMAIEGMTCQSCAAHIESELRKVPGVAEANVNYKKGAAVIVAAPTVTENALREAVSAAGYTLKSANKR